jgi:hypothetical protein
MRIGSGGEDEQRRFLESHRQEALLLTRALATGGRAVRPVSRLGGRPNLPARLEWPRDEDGPLRFLAQLDLDTLSGHSVFGGLRASGMLFFFFNELPFNAAQPGRVLHARREEAAAAPPRDAPADLRPYRDSPGGIEEMSLHLASNRRWAAATRYLPCWLLEARPITDFPAEPSGFHAWPQALRSLYTREYEDRRRARIADQLGGFQPFVQPQARQLVRAGEPMPAAGGRDERDWPPGAGWPYAWLHVVTFAGMLRHYIKGELEWVEWWRGGGSRDRRLRGLERAHAQRAAYIDQNRAVILGWAAEAFEWMSRSQDHDPFSAPDPADVAVFRRWVAGLGEGYTATPIGYFQLAETAILGMDLLLNYAPDVATQVMPPALLRMVLMRHLPARQLSAASSELVRHQFLGTHKAIQRADHGFAVPHRLLAQFDSDSSAWLSLGGGGNIQFWIPEEDWAQQRFDRCVAITETS